MPRGGRSRRHVYEDGPPYNVDQYANLKYPHASVESYLDCERYAKLRRYGERGVVPGTYRYVNANVIWGRRWLHFGGRMAGDPDTITDGPFDMPYIRCYEEVPYMRNLQRLVTRLMTLGDHEVLTVQDRVCFTGRYDYMYFHNKQYWGRDLCDESRMGEYLPGQGPQDLTEDQPGPVFWGWHNVEFHNMINRDRRQFYLRVPDWWHKDYTAERELGVPTPWVLLNCQKLIMTASAKLRNHLYDIAKIEFAIFFVLCHSHAAYYGLDKYVNGSGDHRLHTTQVSAVNGLLFPIPQGFVQTLSQVHPF